MDGLEKEFRCQLMPRKAHHLLKCLLLLSSWTRTPRLRMVPRSNQHRKRMLRTRRIMMLWWEKHQCMSLHMWKDDWLIGRAKSVAILRPSDTNGLRSIFWEKVLRQFASCTDHRYFPFHCIWQRARYPCPHYINGETRRNLVTNPHEKWCFPSHRRNCRPCHWTERSTWQEMDKGGIQSDLRAPFLILGACSLLPCPFFFIEYSWNHQRQKNTWRISHQDGKTGRTRANEIRNSQRSAWSDERGFDVHEQYLSRLLPPFSFILLASGSEAYEAFLASIGEKIELKDWKYFNGGLDTESMISLFFSFSHK